MPLTEGDAAAGFQAGDDVIGLRREEDRRALGGLGAEPIWLEFLDSQYADPPSGETIAGALEALLRRVAPDAVFFPLGLFHSDHRLTRQASLLLEERHGAVRWFAYEDCLYRNIAGLRDEVIEALRMAGLSPIAARFPENSGALERKRNAVACYRSQLRALATPGRPGYADAFAAEAYWQIGAVNRHARSTTLSATFAE
jgi:LmbE family N-acetylglucosaminyl deacetylase